MKKKTLCMLFEAVGPYSAIGRIAETEVHAALDAGYEVTVVAKQFGESLRGRAQWLRLFVPPRLFALQWLTARHFYRQALGERKFDVIHAHQPQTASLADVFECHYLTRVAKETGTLEDRVTVRGRAVRIQQEIALRAEDYYYRRWNPGTAMLYNSAVTRSHFHRIYGPVPLEGLLPPAFPPLRTATPGERGAARAKFTGTQSAAAEGKLVVGYLGGIVKLKGYDRLIDAVRGESSLFLLLGGPYSENFPMPTLAGRALAVGPVSDTPSFYAACDALVVPSVHETFGLVAVEAAARGTPVIATPQVGVAPHLIEYGAGMVWRPGEPLAPLVDRAVADREQFNAGARKMADAHSEANRTAALVEIWERAAARRRATSISTDHG